MLEELLPKRYALRGRVQLFPLSVEIRAPGGRAMTQPAPSATPAWWASLKHGGMLIAPARLVEFFAPDCELLPRHVADRLRRDLSRVRNGDADHLGVLLDTVLEDVSRVRSPEMDQGERRGDPLVVQGDDRGDNRATPYLARR